jgi:hypothetical protein
MEHSFYSTGCGTMNTTRQLRISTGPKVCFCLSLLLWGIWLQNLLSDRSPASSPAPAASVSSVNVEPSSPPFLWPSAKARVTIYRHNPHVYHWQPSCSGTIRPESGKLISPPLRKVLRDQAEAQGYEPCLTCGDLEYSEKQAQFQEIRSEIAQRSTRLRSKAHSNDKPK